MHTFVYRTKAKKTATVDEHLQFNNGIYYFNSVYCPNIFCFICSCAQLFSTLSIKIYTEKLFTLSLNFCV